MVKYGIIDQCSRHLCFGCQQTLPLFLGQIHYPLSGLSPCCFCGASSIPTSKVDTWFRAKPLRITTICHPRDWFRYVHVALLETVRLCRNGWQLLYFNCRMKWFVWGWKWRSRDWRESSRVLVTTFDHISSRARSNPKFFRYLRWWTCLWLKLIWVKFLSLTMQLTDMVNIDNLDSIYPC